MAINRRAGMAEGSTDPASNAVAVTPSDGADLTYTTSALYIGTGGTVVVDMAGGQTAVPFKAVSGQLLPLRVTRVRATSTTAADIVALY